jgi:hypothetical protein
MHILNADIQVQFIYTMNNFACEVLGWLTAPLYDGSKRLFSSQVQNSKFGIRKIY